MGVEGVFPHLTELEVATPVVDMVNIKAVDIDMLIYSAEARYNAFRHGSYSNEATTTRLAHALHSRLSDTFTQNDSTVLHFDGAETSQKGLAREARRKLSSKNVQDLTDFAAKVHAIVAAADNTPISRTTKRRVLRLNRQVKQRWGLARIIDSATKSDLVAHLKDLGWETCHCQGEADVCIGQKADKHPGEVVVASSDSDMLFHRVKELIRKVPRSRTFTSYDLKDVLQRVRVSEVQWVVAGVVTNNDYTRHVQGQSFPKNLALVRECDAGDFQDVLDQYCDKLGVNSIIFGPAKDVFINRFEVREADSTSNEAVDIVMKELVNSVARCLKESKASNAIEIVETVIASVGTSIANVADGDTIAVGENSSRRSVAYRTSGNIYIAKKSTQPSFGAINDAITRPKIIKRKAKEKLTNQPKKQAQKVRQNKLQRNPASRKARQQTEKDTGVPKKRRKRNPGNMVGDVLNGTFKTVTLNLGTTDHRLQLGLQKNFNFRNCPEVQQHIRSTLQDIAKLNTDLVRSGCMAILNYINTVISGHPSISAGSNDIEIRRGQLEFIAYDKHGFFKTLVKALYYGEDIRGTGPSFGAAIKTAVSFGDIPGNEGLKKRISKYLNSAAPSHILEQIGQTLSDMVRCHVRAFVSELKKRAEIWSSEWARSRDGSAFLSTLDDSGISSVHDPISTFWILNTALPSSKRFEYLPMPAYKDNYCVVSEMQLLDTILRMGHDKSMRGLRAKTNYDRHACVANPSNKSLPHLLDLELLPCQDNLLSLETEEASSLVYKQAKEGVKSAIKQHVLALDGTTRAGKYVLTGTLLTDGYQVKMHAYSLVHPWRASEDRRQGSAACLTIPLTSTNRPGAASSRTKSKMRYLSTVISTPEALRQAFGDQDGHVVLAIDPGIKNTATAVIVDSHVPGQAWNLAFSKGSHTLNSRRFALMLEHIKEEKHYGRDSMATVYDLESAIRPFQPNDHPENGLESRFSDLTKSYQEHVKSVFAVEKDLREFYGSRGLKVAKYRREQGEKAEVDRAIAGMLKATRERASIAERRGLVVIGDGDFRGKGGGPIKANKFISRLQSKATGEGMLVCCVDEFRTSIFCCRCHKRVITKGRSVICLDPTCGGNRALEYDTNHLLNPKAGLQRDRDHNAGQNMANAALHWLKEFKWPEALDRQVAKQQ
ncbi:hypothetical protein BGZ98_004744 [Dissophora globulifera]|nr:hypothetical protein BGZ98_004744 [Dissophora globulifera]